MTTPAPLRTTKVWADSIVERGCTASNCRRRIRFATNVASGRPQPFDEIRILARERNLLDREILTIDLGLNHHATCPGASQFRKGKR